MNYAGIIKNDVVNGRGVCVSFWCQGCPHRCNGCHNPETWDFNYGKELFDEDVLIEYILNLISKNGIQRNLSILGGEPLCKENIQFVIKLMTMAKDVYPTIKIFLWSGYTIEEIIKMEQSSYFLTLIDVLIDGKYKEEQRDVSLALRGSTNQRIIDIKNSIELGALVLYECNKTKEIRL